MTPTWLTVFLAALVTAVATGLGAVPFFFIKNVPKHVLGIFNALAGGLMLGASVELLYEGVHYNFVSTLIGLAVGIVVLMVSQRYLVHTEDLLEGGIDAVNFRKMLFIVAMMTVHSFAEGVSIGFAFGSGAAFGALILIAMAIQNVPEGLAISLVLVPKGVKPARAAWWSVFSSLPQPIMAVPAFLFVSTFKAFLPIGLGFAAGAMIWLIFKELIPEAREEASGKAVLITVVLSVLAMVALGQII